MVLAEASSAGGRWRNVVLSGTDPYGTTAGLLARGAMLMAQNGYPRSGVLAPVEALGREAAQEELERSGAELWVIGGPKEREWAHD